MLKASADEFSLQENFNDSIGKQDDNETRLYLTTIDDLSVHYKPDNMSKVCLLLDELHVCFNDKYKDFDQYVKGCQTFVSLSATIGLTGKK